MRVAALDLGTNTFILLVADVEDGRVTRVLHDEVRVVRLGQGVHESRRLHPEAMIRAEECFREFSATLKGLGAERTLACATSAARDVTNGHELLALGAKYDIPISIISGEKEAELTFAGTFAEPLTEPVAIIDVGGGSTEYIIGGPDGIRGRVSIDVGSVRLTELFVSSHPIDVRAMMDMTGYIQGKLSPVRELLLQHPVSKLVAVAGTPTTLAAVDQGRPFDYEHVDGYGLTLAALRAWTQRLANLTVEERQRLSGMDPKRADVIVAGSLILMLSCQLFGAKEMSVSVRGLRYGVAGSLGRGALP